MSQILKPKPLAENPFQEVELIYGSEFRWKVPTKFTFSLRAKFFKIPYDRCFGWLTSEMKKAQQPSSGREPSMVTGSGGIERAIANTLQMQLIPDDSQLDKYIQGFLYLKDVETLKAQLDLICIPINNAPKASEILDQADEETVKSVFDYFFDSVNPPMSPPIDFGAEEKVSKTEITEANTSA